MQGRETMVPASVGSLTTMQYTHEDLAALDWDRLGHYILTRRTELGWSQPQLAERAGTGTRTIWNYENGKRPESRYPRDLGRVIRALGWAQGSDRDILNGGEPTSRESVITGSVQGDAEENLLFILRHVTEAGTRTRRAMRAILEVDMLGPNNGNDDSESEQQQ